MHALTARTSEMIGAVAELPRDKVIANGEYVGGGCGFPVAGMADLIRFGFFKPGEDVVFLHSGGSAALFAYRQESPSLQVDDAA